MADVEAEAGAVLLVEYNGPGASFTLHSMDGVTEPVNYAPGVPTPMSQFDFDRLTSDPLHSEHHWSVHVPDEEPVRNVIAPIKNESTAATPVGVKPGV